LRFLDFGSGFKVAYKEDDIVTNVYDLGLKLTKVFNEFCQSYGRKLELHFEPGKFIVSEAGVLLVKVNVVKATPSLTFACVNSGLNHLLRPMMYDAYHEIVNISNPGGPQKLYTVVGYICETDTFGSDRKPSAISERVILSIKIAGAYVFSVASLYDSHSRPAQVFLLNRQANLFADLEHFPNLLPQHNDIDY